jgi:hypothetical protein
MKFTIQGGQEDRGEVSTIYDNNVTNSYTGPGMIGGFSRKMTPSQSPSATTIGEKNDG